MRERGASPRNYEHAALIDHVSVPTVWVTVTLVADTFTPLLGSLEANCGVSIDMVEPDGEIMSPTVLAPCAVQDT